MAISTTLKNTRKLIKTFDSGSSHYEIYSDGWVRQFGTATSAGDQDTTITYVIPFRDTLYSALASMVTTSTGALGNLSHISIESFTTTTMVVRTNGTIGLSKSWKAEGYGSSSALLSLGITVGY